MPSSFISPFLITASSSLEFSDRFIQVDQRSHSLGLRQLKLFLTLSFFCCGFRLSENIKSMSEFGGGLGPYRPPYLQNLFSSLENQSPDFHNTLSLTTTPALAGSRTSNSTTIMGSVPGQDVPSTEASRANIGRARQPTPGASGRARRSNLV